MPSIFSGPGVSPEIGSKLFAQTIVSDDSGEAMGSGGIQTLVMGSFGTGKSTLLCWMAQMSRYMVRGTKESYVYHLVHKLDTNKYRTANTTVVWRARDQDNWPSMIPTNWRERVKNEGIGKNVALFIHEGDKERVALYILENHVVKPIPHMPRPIYYTSADDLVGKIKEHYVNVVVEPQGYRISPRLAAVIMEAKSQYDNGEGNNQYKQVADEKKDDMDETVKNMRRPGGQKKVDDYTKHAVKTGMFWFDFSAAETALWGNKPLMQVFDESDDFLGSAAAELAWWGTQVWVEAMRDFRKSNLSTVLSTHGWNLLADAIYKRVTHKILLPGIKTGRNTMIKYSQTINTLPKGQFIVELANREFGVCPFARIPEAIMGRIDGLRGSYPALDADKRKWLWGEYEKAWSLEENPPKPKIVPDVINIDPPKEVCYKNLPMVIEQPT